MATPERIVTLRAIKGIDRSPDARISDEGSWYATQNLWSKSTEGLLAKRPGSTCIVDGRAVVSVDPVAGSNPPWSGTISGIIAPGAMTVVVPVSLLPPATLGGGVIDTSVPAAVVNIATAVNGSTLTTAATSQLSGTRGIVPRVNQ